MRQRLEEEILYILRELGFATRGEVVEHFQRIREATGAGASPSAAQITFDSLVRNASRESGSRESIRTLWIGQVVLLVRDAETRSRLFELYRHISTVDPATDRRPNVDGLVQNALANGLDKLIPRDRVIAFASICVWRRPPIPSQSTPTTTTPLQNQASIPSSNVPPSVRPISQHGLDKREINVVSRRFVDPADTLETIAQDWSVTRERIRQIQKEAYVKLVKSSLYADLDSRFRDFLQQFGYLSEGIAMRLATESVDDVSKELVIVIARVTFESLKSGYELHAFESVVIRDNTIEKTIDDLLEVAASCVKPNLSIERGEVVKAAVEEPRFQPVEGWVRHVLENLWEQISTAATGKHRLSRSQATAPALSERVLKEAEHPLHFSEVAARVLAIRRDQGMEPLSEHTVRGTLQQHKDLFAYAGQGTYGLRVWGDDVPYIRDAIKIALESEGKPLTQNEILHEVKKLRPPDSFKDSSISMYLGMNDRFYESRSRKFGLRGWLDPHPTLKTSRDDVETQASARRLSENE